MQAFSVAQRRSSASFSSVLWRLGHIRVHGKRFQSLLYGQLATKSEGAYSRRGEIYAYVTHRPGDNSRDVFGYVTGYDYKGGSEVKVSFSPGGDAVSLFTQDDKAWALDNSDDKKLADLVQKKNKMIVRGVSSRGTKTKDTFSLRGSTSAYKRISKECNMK